MWSAFMNGSGMPGGGGAGGGYVPSQGWEFMPCSGMERADRGRGKSRSPARRISSPPAVFSHIHDSQFGASPGGGDGGAGTQLEIPRGQMWPGLEPLQQQQQQQTQQHARLKKKFEDLKKRHVQDKEEWMREKEALLREVADIQGGENRRILLELKSVLEEVQVEVKREEEKRSELQLQYTRDRCAWELEKAELKCRIAQLEAREGAGFIVGGVGLQSAAAGPGSAPGSAPPLGETATLRREREEQRRLLADTHSAAMDLRCRLELNERDWSREKEELLERFDVERREWECQLKDMQRKIEVLYCDVRTKREVKGGGRPDGDDDDDVHGLSVRSTSSGCSLLSSSSSRSEPVGHPPLPGFVCRDRDGRRSSCFQADRLCGYDTGGQFAQKERSQPELVDELLSSRGARRRQDSATDGEEAADAIALDAMFEGALGCGVPRKNVSNGHGNNVRVHAEERPLWAELSYGSDKKKNATALNAALKEIARVSEELCSYQDEIRKKSGDKRNRSGSPFLPEGSDLVFGRDKTRLEVDEAPRDLGQIYDDLRALERENWIALSPKNTRSADRGPSKSWIADFADPGSRRATKTGLLSEMDTAGPAIPPRSSSWNLSSPTFPDTELHIPESPVTTARKCHSPCALPVDRKCGSPSIVRKFGAMLQENEGKVLIDGVVASRPVPANPECVNNKGCCHNRWSCDASKFTSSKLSTHGTVQKSFSEVNILTAARVLRSDHCVGSPRSPELQIPQIVKELPLDLLLSSLEVPPAGPDLQGSRRNIMLEQKTAEFNRTLFQAEMGRGKKKQNGCTVADAGGSVGSRPVFSPTRAPDEMLPPGEKPFQPLCTDVTAGARPEITSSLSTSNSTIQNPEVQSRRTRCGAEGQEVRTKRGIPSDLSSDLPQIGLRETTTTTSRSLAHRREVEHKVQTASGASRKATEVLFPEPFLPGQGVAGSGFENENPHGAKPQSARVAVSLQQLSAESKHRPVTSQPGQHQARPRHGSVLPSQPDSSRPGPRMMNDHPWKALTLAAYPRPEGSRSNYGAVERILKSYESAARAHQNQSRPNEMDSGPNVVPEPDIDPLPFPPAVRHAQTPNTSQLSSHSAAAVKELPLTVQENGVTSASSSSSSSSAQKNFSRPTRPANRRLPSRWAGRSPTSSSSSSSSMSMSSSSSATTSVVPPSFALHKHSSSFSHSHAFHIESVII